MDDKKQAKVELKLDQGIQLAEAQKVGIYDSYLSSLKSQIAEFIFVDSTIATELMQAYNELLSQFDKSDTLSIDMLKHLNDLEARVEREKRESLKQTSENVTAFESKCISLLEDLSQNTIEQTEEGWRKLKGLLENGNSNYTLEQRSQIQNLLSNLHFHIIKEKIRGNTPNLDLKEEIPEVEQAEMKVAMYYQAARLLNDPSDRKKKLGQKIKASMQLYSQASEEMQMLYDKSIWEDFIQDDGKSKSSEMTKNQNAKSNSLALVPQRRNIFRSLWNSLRRKTEIEKIADEVVTSEMLEKFIDYSVPQSQRYIPDKKLPVYLLLQQLEQLHNQKEISISSFPCRVNNGVIYNCKIDGISRAVNAGYYTDKWFSIKFQSESGRQLLEREDYTTTAEWNPIILIQFANFLGYGEEFSQQLGNFYYDEPKDGYNYRIWNEKFAKKLCKRLDRALKEYSKSKDKFFFEEDERRSQASSKRNQFVEELRTIRIKMTQLPRKTETEIYEEKSEER